MKTKNETNLQSELIPLDNFKIEKAIDAILYGFDWAKTKQGAKYWKDVLDNLIRIKNKGYK